MRNLEIDDEGRIWVASPGQFGYFERRALGQLAYHSISEQLPENEQDFGETRFVRLLGDSVYFNTHHRLYRWATRIKGKHKLTVCEVVSLANP